MLETKQHTALAHELAEAERTRVQVEQFSRRHPAMTMADSYAIQREWVRLQREAGRKVVGHKIGLTSRAMQIASQITEPDYGTLLDSLVLRDGSEVEAARFIVPRFEVEFAFILARPLAGPGVTVFDVLNATDFGTAWPGWPTSWHLTVKAWPPVRSCWAAASRARCPAQPVTPSMLTMARWAAFR